MNELIDFTPAGECNVRQFPVILEGLFVTAARHHRPFCVGFLTKICRLQFSRCRRAFSCSRCSRTRFNSLTSIINLS